MKQQLGGALDDFCGDASGEYNPSLYIHGTITEPVNWRKRQLLSSGENGSRQSREKMICKILLLISLTSCVCGTFVVKVTQTSYQAEENDNITLEWMFTTKPDSSSTSLNIICQLFTDVKHLILYHVHEGVESPESQDGQFAGRVQCDKDALREGRIRLHVSRLRTDDSGLYLCEMKTDYGESSGRCRLNVTAVDQPKPQKPTVRPQPESRGRIGLYVGLTAAVLAVCSGLYSAFRLHFSQET
ncbi:butyrophilin-like protein 8 isoform X2 [Thunnus maccoyii]|uniref:butyrophilin-like protein 8 isoform X2 n=1 Tax=Thunnus maccoyii TaxID=8240 RepID=UPI001C4DA836|nr:butyrophilin-like protein 8 isoform X2 [Thunnus maccoyii]